MTAPDKAAAQASAGWTTAETQRVGNAEELQIASRRPDGTLRRYVTIWVVRIGNEIFVRSARGPENPWYVRAVACGSGRIRAGDVEREVAVTPAADADQAAIDSAYHTKYDRYGPNIVNTVVGPSAARTTLRLTPQA